MFTAHPNSFIILFLNFTCQTSNLRNYTVSLILTANAYMPGNVLCLLKTFLKRGICKLEWISCTQWWIQDLQKGGGHKILDLLSLLPHIYKINKTTRWEVVKNSASPKRPFFFRLHVIFPIFIAFPVQIINKTYLFIHFLATTFSVSYFT